MCSGVGGVEVRHRSYCRDDDGRWPVTSKVRLCHSGRPPSQVLWRSRSRLGEILCGTGRRPADQSSKMFLFSHTPHATVLYLGRLGLVPTSITCMTCPGVSSAKKKSIIGTTRPRRHRPGHERERRTPGSSLGACPTSHNMERYLP
jgi:hypothetical protein